jgi:hypothetical protein
MSRPATIAHVSLFMLLALAGLLAYGEEYYSDHGFAIDLPEGFEFIEGDASTRYSFGSPDGAVRVDIAVYPATRFASAQAGAADSMRRVSGHGDFMAFSYSGADAALGEMDIGSGGDALKGLGLFLNDAAPPAGAPAGAPAGGEGKATPYDLVILAYAPAAAYAQYHDVIVSCVDGFSANYGRRAVPGPVGSAVRYTLGRAKPVPVTVRFGAASVLSSWVPAEAEVAQELVEREYRVLSAYAQAPELIESAVTRFYRMIYRDAAPSLDRLALDMSMAWETGAWAGKAAPATLLDAAAPGTPASDAAKTAPTGPRFGTTATPRAYAESLLAWVQTFVYERNPEGSDVVNPISAAFQGRGDCDSRALVMAILLRREDIDAIMMVSLKHEHALAGVDAPGSGARFPFKDRRWLVAETTARVGIGMLDAGQADPSDWIGVAFPR